MIYLINRVWFFFFFAFFRTRIHREKTVGNGSVVHAVCDPWHRPRGRRRGGRRAMCAARVHGRGSGRTCGADWRAGGQHDGRGHARKIGKQQSRSGAAGQETVPDGRLRARRRFVRRGSVDDAIINIMIFFFFQYNIPISSLKFEQNSL